MPTRSHPRFRTAAILAGGESVRMGFDKQTMHLGDVSALDAILRRLRGMFEDIVVVSSRPDLYVGRDDVRVIGDVFAGAGPMGGVHAALRAAQSEYVFVTGCDMPEPSAPFIARMEHLLDAESAKGPVAGAVVCRTSGHLEPLHAFYHRDLVDPMAEALRAGHRGLADFCRAHPMLEVPEAAARAVDPELRMFRNINDFSELAAWRDGRLPEDGGELQGRVRRVDMRRVTAAGVDGTVDRVVIEGTLTVVLDDAPFATMHALPERWRDLALGALWADGAIASIADVATVTCDVCGDDATVRVARTARETRFPRAARPRERMFPSPTSEEIVWALRELDRFAHIFRATGGTHNMLLVDAAGDVVDHVEDVSRHACLLKLMGRALDASRDLSTECLVVSCRLTATLVERVIRADIPLVVASGAVTTAALALAEAHRVRLIGFARDRRFSDYGDPPEAP